MQMSRGAIRQKYMVWQKNFTYRIEMFLEDTTSLHHTLVLWGRQHRLLFMHRESDGINITYATMTPFNLSTLWDHRGFLIDIDVDRILGATQTQKQSLSVGSWILRLCWRQKNSLLQSRTDLPNRVSLIEYIDFHINVTKIWKQNGR